MQKRISDHWAVYYYKIHIGLLPQGQGLIISIIRAVKKLIPLFSFILKSNKTDYFNLQCSQVFGVI